MAAKKIKLEEETTSQILVTDTDSESGAEAGDAEDEFKKNNNDDHDNDGKNKKPQQKTIHRLKQVAEDYQSGHHLKERTQIFILLSVQQKE